MQPSRRRGRLLPCPPGHDPRKGGRFANGAARGFIALLVVILALGLPRDVQAQSSPIQGHYTGPWHSDGQYHFDVPYCTGVDLTVTIDGTLDLTVASNGEVTGTATGKVDAPIYDCGRHDVSSGYGTISGQVAGLLDGNSSQLLLGHPVIDMHWGTFVGGNYTVERFITMPNYTFSGPAGDCTTAQGTIDEQDFPVQNVVADGQGQMTQAPGIGKANGTWQITSDSSAMLKSLSAQIDSFIAASNSVLAASNLTAATVGQSVVQPLQTLESSVNADPGVASCLMPRLRAWQTAAVSALYARVSTSDSSLPALREAENLLGAADALNTDGSVSDNGAAARLKGTETSALDGSIASGNWSESVLRIRELMLWQGDSIRGPMQKEVNADLHARLQSTTSAATRLQLARVAYALGDDADVSAAYKLLTAGHTRTANSKKRKQTLQQLLTAGVSHIKGNASGSTFSWQPVKGAQRYLVTTLPPTGPLLWTWSGNATTVSYGDTTIEGMTDSTGNGWPVPAVPAERWTVLALDGQGRIVGIKLR